MRFDPAAHLPTVKACNLVNECSASCLDGPVPDRIYTTATVSAGCDNDGAPAAASKEPHSAAAHRWCATTNDTRSTRRWWLIIAAPLGTLLDTPHDSPHHAARMEDTNGQHPTGHACNVCHGLAIVEIDGGSHLCAEHAIEAMVTVDPRAVEATVTIDLRASQLAGASDASHAARFVGAGRPGTCLDWHNFHSRSS